VKTESSISNKKQDSHFQFSGEDQSHILRIIQMNLYVVFVWKNEKGWPVEYVSENVNDVFGYTAKDFMSKDILYSDIIYPADLPKLQQERIEESSQEFNQKFTLKTYRITDKTGDLHYIEDRTIIVRESNGKIKYFEGIIQDITERKKIEDELIFRFELEKRVSQISSYIVQSNFLNIKEVLSFAAKHIGDFLEVDYSYVVLKDSTAKKFKIEYEYIANGTDKINLHYHEKTLNKFNWLFSDLVKGKVIIISDTNLIENCAVEEKNFFKNSNVKSLILIPFFYDKNFAGYLGFFFSKNYSVFTQKDSPMFKFFSEILSTAYKNYLISIEHKKNEDKLLKLNHAVEQSANSIVITDVDGNIEFVNPKFEKITGYSQEEVLGENPRFLKSGHTKPEEYANLWRTILRGEIWKGELKNTSKTGETFWESVTISPIKNNENIITHFIAIKEDITERIRVQNQLALSQKMESIGQLAAGIAHEINTPLQYVGDNINFLSDSYKAMLDVLFDFSAFLEDGNEYTNDEIRDFYQNKKEEMDLEFIYEEVPQALEQTEIGINKVTKIVRAMKDFAHPGTKKKAYQDLNKGIENTVTISKNEWKYVADVELNLDKNITAVFCLLDELNQVFLNMIINAAHAIAEKVGEKPEQSLRGKIYIETKKESLPEGDNIIIKFSDTGNGIEQGNINKIFDPFFTTKEVGKGTGQGLAIAHDIIINKHNGKISVESVVEKGTTFTITLPIDEKDEGKK